MRKSRTIKKLLTAMTVTVLGAAFTVSAGACAHKHTYSSDWSVDGTYHWHAATCAHTDEVSGKSAHEYGDDDICDICAYDKSTGTVTPPPSGGETNDKLTVSFETAGGTVIESKTVNKNDTVNVDDPTRPGYTFAGWYSDEDLTIPFIMGTTKITESITIYAHWKSNSSTAEVKKNFTVTFDSKGGTSIAAQTVTEGNKAVKPADPEYVGNQFLGWYTNAEYSGSTYGFTGPVQGNITLYAKWQPLNSAIKTIKTYNESLAIEWSDGAPSQAKVEYKSTGTNTWTEVDAPLIRGMGSGTARVDIVGLAAGDYDVKIIASDNNEITPAPITVTAYDRSGYAHFNYTNGVGAYKDDGTLKDNAIVIYVTDENKDTVMDDIAAKYDAVNMFKIPNQLSNNWNNKNASSIGWWLNNAQYSKAEKDKNGKVVEAKTSNTYSSTGNKLGFADPTFNAPVVIRFIGTVTTPEGCTAYDSYAEGGSEGDNGHMARMKNLKNITLEGIGEDAVISGWGFHFMRGTDATGDFGTSFEARNLTFDKYPEDALGMEGVQESGKITASVERCWIHNNTFLPGYCANPAESDKKEGDGSCDFKRGMYYTLSYNTFEYCHKTNLVGSSDSSLQYNITMHHNMWYNCGSRIPLLRQANIHFYNNFVYADANDDKAALSYVHSLRANSYMFSEANYYDGCKQVTDGKSGGDAKGWNNMYVSCFGGSSMVPAQTREEIVDNKCAYNGTSFKTFDTDPNLFYYDATNKVSDCLLDDAVTARAKVILYAGVNGFGTKNLPTRFNGTTLMNKYTPQNAVPVPEDEALSINLSPIGKAKKDTEVSGILFRGINGESSGAMKFRGQGITFTLATEAALTVTATTLGDSAPILIAADGTVISQFEGKLEVTLPAGTYVILSGQKDKDSNISLLSFASTAGSAQAKIDNLNAAIDALPANITIGSATLVNAAKTALEALNANEFETYKTENAERWTKYQNALAAYSLVQIADVIAKIDAIGTVNDNSYPSIKTARDAYNALSQAQQSQVTNFSTLTAAETEWSNRAVTAINNQIAALEDVTSWTTDKGKDTINAKKAEYEAVKTAYEALTSTTGVNNYSKVTNGLTKLNGLLADIAQAEVEAANLADFTAKLNALTVATVDITNGTELETAYNKLTQAQKDGLSAEAAEKYADVIEQRDYLIAEEKKNTVIVNFNSNDGSPNVPAEHSTFDITKTGGTKKDKAVTIEGTEYAKGFKMAKNGAATVSIKIPATYESMTLKLYFYESAGQKVIIDGTTYTIGSDNTVTVTGLKSMSEATAETPSKAITHTITTADKEINLYVLKLTKEAATSSVSYTLESQIDLSDEKLIKA